MSFIPQDLFPIPDSSKPIVSGGSPLNAIDASDGGLSAVAAAAVDKVVPLSTLPEVRGERGCGCGRGRRGSRVIAPPNAISAGDGRLVVVAVPVGRGNTNSMSG